jgi:hypothetical protein
VSLPAPPTVLFDDAASADVDATVRGNKAPRKRRRRKRSVVKQPTVHSPFAAFLLSIGVYLAGLAFVVFIWLSLVIVTLLGSKGGAGLIVYGVVVWLVGTVWLYVCVVMDGEMPASPWDFHGRNIIAALIMGAMVLVQLGLFIFYGVMYTISNPSTAWKPVLLAVLGLVIVGSGILFLSIPP